MLSTAAPPSEAGGGLLAELARDMLPDRSRWCEGKPSDAGEPKSAMIFGFLEEGGRRRRGGRCWIKSSADIFELIECNDLSSGSCLLAYPPSKGEDCRREMNGRAGVCVCVCVPSRQVRNGAMRQPSARIGEGRGLFFSLCEGRAGKLVSQSVAMVLSSRKSMLNPQANVQTDGRRAKHSLA